ncbi:hypothetical protein [Maribacter sp. 2304DJ31-5]|uniref:hypothetical protein n=1 Tax=Maribacter sp. 2304DJ31-5 TaxID=3386273 RepID=UPI0039BD7013
MSNKDLKELQELAEDLKNEVTVKIAMESLISAGILNSEGEHTDNYESLEEIIVNDSE